MKKLSLVLILTLTFLIAQPIKLAKVEIDAIDTYNDLIIEKESFFKSAPMQKFITIKQALQIAGTNGDPIKALKSYAGVVSTNNDDGSELYIHGSRPRETKFSINHLPIGYLFHLGGLHSVIAPEMTEQIDTYLGGFDVSYEAMGAVVDITPKYPIGSNIARVHVGMYDADFSFDKSISENINLFIGARRSYFDLIANQIMDKIDQDEKKLSFTLFPQFYDGQMILSTNIENHALSLEAIVAQDEMILHNSSKKQEYQTSVGQIDSKISSNTIGARWIYFGETVTSNTLFYRLNSTKDIKLPDKDYFVDTKITEFGLYNENVFELNNHKPMVGFEIIFLKAPLNAYMKNPPTNDYKDPIFKKDAVFLQKVFNAKNYTIFIQDIWSITSKHRFRYGFRAWKSDFQKFGYGIDPRFAYVFNFSDTFTISTAIGKYSQLPEAIYIIEKLGNENIDTYEFANHYTLSFQKKFQDKSSLIFEPYFKKFNNLVIEDQKSNYKATGTGKAYGFDITYKKNSKNFDLVFAYTYVRAKRELNTNTNKQYSFEGDIPNSFNINFNYRFANNFRISSFFKYSDGAPYTPIIEIKDQKPIYGEPYSSRRSSSFDLDIQIGKTYYFNSKKKLELYLELMNLTSIFKKNIIDISYNETKGKYYQIGFLPALHLNYQF